MPILEDYFLQRLAKLFLNSYRILSKNVYPVFYLFLLDILLL